MMVSELKIIEGDTDLDLDIKGLKHEVFLRNHPSGKYNNNILLFDFLGNLGVFHASLEKGLHLVFRFINSSLLFVDCLDVLREV